MNAITTCDMTSRRATAWIPPESSHRLPLEKLRVTLCDLLGDMFQGGTFDKERGLTLNFAVTKKSDRSRIRAGLRRVGVIAN